MPLPTGLVVKKGSKTRSSTSGGDALAGVGEADPDEIFIPFDIAGGDAELAAAGHCVAGVDRRVEHRGLELGGIDLDRPSAGAEIEHHPDRAADGARRHLGEGVEAQVEVDHLGLERLAAAEGEQVAGQRGGAVGGVDDRFEIAARRCSLRSARRQQFGRAADHGHQIVEIVGDAAGQLADRLQLLRLEERGARLLQLLLRPALLGDVAGDLGEADMTSLVVADRIDDDMGAEAGAVLAHAPGLFLIFAVAQRGLERARRLAGGAVLVRVEEREMAADDLVRAIALDRLRARIPVATPGRRDRACRSHSRERPGRAGGSAARWR